MSDGGIREKETLGVSVGSVQRVGGEYLRDVQSAQEWHYYLPNIHILVGTMDRFTKVTK
jgi:hypothetical protein